MMRLSGTPTAAAAPQNSDAAAAAAAAAAAEGSEEMSDRGFGGNRWPRQETLALLKIRSDMDIAFRDASVKGPLWDEVARKMAELGYNRNAKKCKEKFENVYKYHKRTKEGRTGKSERKTYRFFDQLQALENQSSSSSSVIHHHHHQTQPQPQTHLPPLQPRPPNHSGGSNSNAVFSATLPQPTANANANADNPPPPPPPGIAVATVTSTMPHQNVAVPTPAPTPTLLTQPIAASANANENANAVNVPSAFPSISEDFFSDSTPSSSSSSTSSDVDIGGGTRRKRKRKWKEFFERLMRQVVEKQEELQRRFFEAVEKREHDRMVREEAWRSQEMARINREREILAQERSMTAAKDAAVMTFLQKLNDNNIPNLSHPNPTPIPPPPQPQPQPPQPRPQPQSQPSPQPLQPPQAQPAAGSVLDMAKLDNGERNFAGASSSRWPKVEIEALIKLRTNLDSKYQENGPKGPLWEEISAGMRRLGFNRSSKRCKEKWENINKYFKKVKESNKKRPEDSKTCPYFHQLDALYRERNNNNNNNNIASTSSTSTAAGGRIKPENANAVPLMVQPEQQWPPATQMQKQTQTQTHQGVDDVEGFGRNPDHEGDDDDEDDGGRDGEDDDVDDDDDDDDGDGGEFEIVPSSNNKMG